MQLDQFNIPLEKSEQLLSYLSEYITRERKEHFDRIIPQRTKHITVVLEDIYQSQNASAVLRTCESLGIQDIHIIEDKHEYTLNPKVTVGCAKWLHLHKYAAPDHTTISCLKTLKEKGYQLVATTPHKNDITIHDLELDQPIALMFGTEKHGLSKEALDMADTFVRIPMYGFSESFNISVSAAMCLQETMFKLRQSSIDWKLTKQEQINLELEWSYKSIRRSDLMVKEFLSSNS